MSTAFGMEMLNHCVVHLKLILHCRLTNWNLNKDLKNVQKENYKNIFFQYVSDSLISVFPFSVIFMTILLVSRAFLI